jgi:tetratricopeptide (TPR) repeat protein
MNKYSILSFFCICLFTASLAQNPRDNDEISPKTYFNINDYNRALAGYLKLWPKDQGNLEMNRNIAICYLSVNEDKAKALPYLHYLLREGVNDEEVIFMLGQAYMYAYKFDEALKYFNSFRSKTNAKNYEMADLYISYCNNGKEMVEHPLNVTFENLGKEVNSKYPDYYPFVIQSEGILYFTSRRETNTGNISSWEGYFTSDIWSSKVVNGLFTKAHNLGTLVNTSEDEQCVYLTPDGKNMIVYQDNERLHITGDLFLSAQGKGKSFPKPIGFDEPLNTDDLELEGCITADLKTMIISSDRRGGLGETDLYMLKQLPSGKWAAPLNLGPNINTKYREAFPVYDEQSHTLYFASEGPKSMGGFDIFKSTYDSLSKSFGPPENMGYPINTPEDNMEFTFAGNRRDGYISAVRPEGYGDLDLYKVTFNEVEIRQTILKGKITTEDSIKALTATVTLYDAATNAEIGSKDIDGENAKYIFLLKPGKYIVKVTAENFAEYRETVTILDKSDYVMAKEKNIVLLRPGSQGGKPDPKKGKPKTTPKKTAK